MTQTNQPKVDDILNISSTDDDVGPFFEKNDLHGGVPPPKVSFVKTLHEKITEVKSVFLHTKDIFEVAKQRWLTYSWLEKHKKIANYIEQLQCFSQQELIDVVLEFERIGDKTVKRFLQQCFKEKLLLLVNDIVTKTNGVVYFYHIPGIDPDYLEYCKSFYAKKKSKRELQYENTFNSQITNFLATNDAKDFIAENYSEETIAKELQRKEQEKALKAEFYRKQQEEKAAVEASAQAAEEQERAQRIEQIQVQDIEPTKHDLAYEQYITAGGPLSKKEFFKYHLKQKLSVGEILAKTVEDS